MPEKHWRVGTTGRWFSCTFKVRAGIPESTAPSQDRPCGVHPSWQTLADSFRSTEAYAELARKAWSYRDREKKSEREGRTRPPMPGRNRAKRARKRERRESTVAGTPRMQRTPDEGKGETPPEKDPTRGNNKKGKTRYWYMGSGPARDARWDQGVKKVANTTATTRGGQLRVEGEQPSRGSSKKTAATSCRAQHQDGPSHPHPLPHQGYGSEDQGEEAQHGRPKQHPEDPWNRTPSEYYEYQRNDDRDLPPYYQDHLHDNQANPHSYRYTLKRTSEAEAKE